MTNPTNINAHVTFDCPCGATGYEVDFEPADFDVATQISFKCDECRADLAVDADVRVQVRGGAA